MRRSSGFTLLELLAVLVIVSAVSGLLARNLGTSQRLADHRALMAQVRDLDARARLLARHSGGATLMITPDHRELLVMDSARAEIFRKLEGARFEITAPPNTRALSFDSRGRSPSYSLSIRTDESAVRMQVAGSSGWIHTDIEDGR